MNINPQYTFDNIGNPVGVFLPIDEWNNLSKEIHLDIPRWQKDLIDARMAEYHRDPANLLDWEDVKKELDIEDEAL